MKPVTQTKRGGYDAPPEERGDCWPACLASILELPLDAVAVPHSDDPAVHWWDVTREALAPHGVYVAVADVKIYPDGHWLAIVPSLNLKDAEGTPLPHVIVMRGGEVAHDPHLGDRYAPGTPIGDLDVKDAYVLVPFEYRQARSSPGGLARRLYDDIPNWKA